MDLTQMIGLLRNRIYKRSFSQCGEDLIVNFILKNVLKIKNPNFLDVGAYHPFKLNNTYIFYRNGARGVNIEPNPIGFKLFEKKRKKDINLQIGISDQSGELNYFKFNSDTLNTFSTKEAKKYQEEENIPIKAVELIHVVDIAEIFKAYFTEGLDFLTLDVEGLDLIILKRLLECNMFPTIICVETIKYSMKRIEKDFNISNLLTSNGYIAYADTMINSIFVLKKELENRYTLDDNL